MKMRNSLASLAILLLTCASMTANAQILGDVVDSESFLDQESRTRVGKRDQIKSGASLIGVQFTGLAVEVGSSSTDVSAEFRFESGGTWTAWIPGHVVASATGGTLVAGYRQDGLISANRYEFRIWAPEEANVIIRSAGTFNNLLDEDRLPVPDQPPLVGTKSGIIVPPALLTRAQWNAQPFRGTKSNLARPTHEYLTWHHAAGFSAETRAEGEAQMRAMQDLHQNIRGWSDIGYQFGIDRGGRLYQGRPFMDSSTSLAQVPRLALGAHVGGHNTGNIGVVLMGCYHPPEGSHCAEEVTPEAFATYITLFSFLSERYGVSPTLIRGHRDFSSTACPGDNNYQHLPELRSRVTSLLVTGNQLLGEGGITATVDDDGVIDLQWTIDADFGFESVEIERITSAGTETIISDATGLASYIDASLAGESEVTYLLIASGPDGRRQEMARVVIDIENPASYVLTRAFPNPSANAVTFKYFLSVRGIVTTRLYDALGREVLNSDDGFQDEDQWYTNRISVTDLPAGVYYFRISVESFGGVTFDRTHPVVVSR